jgi:AraC-like DNA-binding protein
VFHPGGAGPFFGRPAGELAGGDVPLECLWRPADAARLRERLLAAPTPSAAIGILEATLAARFDPPPPDTAVAAALAAFHRAPHAVRVEAVAEAVGLSRKRLLERFRDAVGLTPKQFCRVRRFQQALTQAHAARDVDWADVATSCGYYDQAHFIHDFRAFSGLTPTGYRAARTAFRNHVTFLQSPAG